MIGVLALPPVAAIAPGASAHSLKDLEAMLGNKEKFFQQLDNPAPDFILRSADDRTVRLGELRDNVVVLNFVYASCPDVCPLHAEKIAEVQRMVNSTPMREQVRFVTVTTDPVRDTPQVMREYGPAHGLDPINWAFLTAARDEPEDSTRRLAESYGHKFCKMADDYQLHGIVTHVIDREGRWRGNFHGLRFAPVNMVLFVNALANDKHKPSAESGRNLWERFKGLFREGGNDRHD